VIVTPRSPPATDHACSDRGRALTGAAFAVLGAVVLVIAVLGWITPEPQTVDDPFDPHVVGDLP